MSATLIEWLVGVLFLGVLLLLIAARIHFVRRRCPSLRDVHWMTSTVDNAPGPH